MLTLISSCILFVTVGFCFFLAWSTHVEVNKTSHLQEIRIQSASYIDKFLNATSKPCAYKYYIYDKLYINIVESK